MSYRYPSSLQKLCDSLLGVTVGSNTDNAAYDMTIQSQCQWAQYLPTYPNTFYLSIVGRISPNIGQVLPPEDVSNSLWLRTLRAIYSAWIQFFFYLISVKDMKISQIDCSHWFYFGWDGLVSCYSQLKPSLPSPYPHPSDQSSPVENSILQGMSPGIWHSWELPNDHLRVSMCCNQSWELIWHAVEEMHSSKWLSEDEDPIKSGISSPPMSQLPDLQSAHIGQLNRDHIAYPITITEKFIGIYVVIFGLVIVLNDKLSLAPFQYFFLPSSLLTFSLGNWLIHSSPYMDIHSSKSGYGYVKVNLQSVFEYLSISSSFLHSEILMMFANLLRILTFLYLSSTVNIESIMSILILTRSLEIATLVSLCPSLHEHCSILQLSVALIVICCSSLDSFASILSHCSSIRYFLTSLLLKESLHILSRLGWVINSQQHKERNIWWPMLWVSYLILSFLYFGSLFYSLSMDSWIFFVLLWEWIGSMREMSYAYQIFSLNSSSSRGKARDTVSS